MATDDEIVHEQNWESARPSDCVDAGAEARIEFCWPEPVGGDHAVNGERAAEVEFFAESFSG